MRMLHICFISQEYPPDTGWGGIGSYTYEMAHALTQMGHRVTIIARAIGPERVTNDTGVQIHRLQPAPQWDRWKGFWRLNRVWPGFAWAAMIRLKHIHARSPIDVVEAAECRGDSLFIPLLRNRPKIITRLHTAWIFVDRLNAILPDKKKRFIYWQEEQTILRADEITSPCRAMIDLTETWLPLRYREIQIVSNPVNTATFAPATGPRRKEVLFVGRLERRKGAETLAQAIPYVLRRCPGASFRFIGEDSVDSSGRSWRERILDDLLPAERTRVHFEHIPRAALVQHYRQSALCVVPSVWENFPYVLLEAMACGTPVVATRTGGIPELIEDGVSGFLVPPENPRHLADTLLELLENLPLREKLGRESRKRMEEQFSVQRVVPRMLAAYNSVLDGC